MYKSNNKTNVFTQKYKDELLFNRYKKKVQKGGNDKDISDYQYELANCYMYGKGVNINHNEALHYFKIASYCGHMKAQYYLGNYYEDGKYIEKNINKAVYWCRKSAEQNFDLAQNKMGCYYEIGEYVEKNNIEAINMFKKAAEQNNSVAQNNLGLCYEYGKGTKKNITEAIKWYKKSSLQDNCRAHCNLGNCYKYNKGITKHEINMKIAFKLYQKAIEQGCICEDTVYEYALCFENGEGIEKDMVKAFILYKKAADLDYPKACYKVSEFYRCGTGIKINLEESIKWFEKAKKLGYCIHSQKNLEKSRAKTAFENTNTNTNTNSDSEYDSNDSVCDECDGCSYCDDDYHDKHYHDNVCDEEDLENPANKDDCDECAECDECDDDYYYDNDNVCNDCAECKEKDIENFNKELLDYYTNKLKIVSEYKIRHNIYDNTYNEDEDYIEYKNGLKNHLKNNNETNDESEYITSSDIKYFNMLYLKYNYNCGVLHYKLRNYEKAIEYYEEAAYNKYPLAQKALSYCYKYGIYYEQSLETSQIWNNLYLYKIKYIEDVD